MQFRVEPDAHSPENTVVLHGQGQDLAVTVYAKSSCVQQRVADKGGTSLTKFCLHTVRRALGLAAAGRVQPFSTSGIDSKGFTPALLQPVVPSCRC